MAKVLQFRKKEEMKDLMDWDWEDFKAVWESIKETDGEDVAWQAIYDLWQARAEEQK